MATLSSFEEIKAWQSAREICRLIYSLCEDGRLSNDFGLKDQVRRSAVSIGSNIAEGFGRGSGNQELIRFLRISLGSASEFRSQLYTLRDCDYISAGDFNKLYELSVQTAAQIGGFIRYLESSKP